MSALDHTSREWEISERLRVLIRKASNGTMTYAERRELSDLQRERVERMTGRTDVASGDTRTS